MPMTPTRSMEVDRKWVPQKRSADSEIRVSFFHIRGSVEDELILRFAAFKVFSTEP